MCLGVRMCARALCACVRVFTLCLPVCLPACVYIMCACVCVLVYAHACVCVCWCLYLCARFVCVCACVRALPACLPVYSVCVGVCVRVHAHVCVYVRAFACVHVLCVCVRINTIHKQHVMIHGYLCACAGECVRETRREFFVSAHAHALYIHICNVLYLYMYI